MALGRQMVILGQGSSPYAPPAPAPSLTGGSGAVGGAAGDGRERVAAAAEEGNEDGCQQSRAVSLHRLRI